jgi:hypothetical protein
MIRTWAGPERGMSHDGSGALHGISLGLQLRFWMCRLGSRRLKESRKSQLAFGDEKFPRYQSGVLSI